MSGTAGTPNTANNVLMFYDGLGTNYGYDSIWFYSFGIGLNSANTTANAMYSAYYNACSNCLPLIS